MVAVEVETVLAAMRRRPEWHQRYVERPLARKEPPVLPGPRTPDDPAREPTRLALVEDHEIDDARLLSQAAVAVSRLTARLQRGNASRQTVVEILRSSFCSGTGAEELGRMPGAGTSIDETLDALLADPDVVERVVAVMAELSDAPLR
jgi:hypothetical protein